MAERKIFNFESKILAEMTLEKEGFDITNGYQKKHIWAICRYCGSPNRVLGSNYKKSNSTCHKECRLKEQSELGSPFSDPEIRKKAQENITKTISRAELNKKISKARKLVQSDIEKTNIEKYGFKNVFQNQDIKNKIKQTNLNKYGFESAMKNKQISEKSKIGYTDEIKQKASTKRKKTNLSTYGCENPQQNTDIKLKSVKKFNETIKQDDNYYKTINTLRDFPFWIDMEKGFTLNELSLKYDLNYGSLTAKLLDEEFRKKYYKIYRFPTQQKQKSVYDFLLQLGLSPVFNDRSVLFPLELDIYIPEKNFAIEFNGNYWHSECVLSTKDSRNKHIEKTNKCKEKGIFLFHLFENTWDTRKEQVSNFLLSKLGLNSNKIYARKCLINNDINRDFIDSNHIQKSSNSTIKYFNLLFNHKTVAVMTASKHHRDNNCKDIILSRLCFEKGTTVTGGASKLFSAFKEWAKKEGYQRIISWSDNIYTDGNIYKKLDFILEEELKPDYFYWDVKNNTYLSKQSQAKNRSKCPINKTEVEWARERDLYRIWDAGKKRWIYNL